MCSFLPANLEIISLSRDDFSSSDSLSCRHYFFLFVKLLLICNPGCFLQLLWSLCWNHSFRTCKSCLPLEEDTVAFESWRGVFQCSAHFNSHCVAARKPLPSFYIIIKWFCVICWICWTPDQSTKNICGHFHFIITNVLQTPGRWLWAKHKTVKAFLTDTSTDCQGQCQPMGNW